MTLEGKTAIVTGAGYGIGEVIARMLAREGAAVVLAARSRDRIKAVAAEIIAEGGRALAVATDVADEGAVAKMIDAAAREFGGVHILVNNAGIAGPTKLSTEISADEWNETISTNLTGAWLCAKHAAPHMLKAGGGSIVNVSSVAGRVGYPFRTPYAASKWGMIGLSHSIAAELGNRNIRSNVVCPGPVAGERMERVIAARAEAQGIPLDKARKMAVSGVPMGRMVTPEEVAEAVLYFASDRSDGVTGQVISVCGGLRMQ